MMLDSIDVWALTAEWGLEIYFSTSEEVLACSIMVRHWGNSAGDYGLWSSISWQDGNCLLQHSGQNNHHRPCTIIYSALRKYWNSKVKIALLAVEYKYDSKMNMRQNYRMSHFIIGLFNTDVLPAKKFSTFRVWSLDLMWAEVLGQLPHGSF